MHYRGAGDGNGVQCHKDADDAIDRPRRTFMRMTLAALAGSAAARYGPWMNRARAEQPLWRHGLSLFGDLRYPPGFSHFDYVNSIAPKGGSVRRSVLGTYDNFNIVVSELKGNLAAGLELIYETLLTPSLDEASSAYGLLAEAVTYPSDFSSATYRLRAGAIWHDGVPVTPSDVIFSLYVLKQNNPQMAAYYRHVADVVRTGEREVTFTFDSPGNRELPQIVGELPVLPKHWWEATDKQGQRRHVTETTLEAPMGSGPYSIKTFEPGRTIAYQRVSNYWGNNLNVRIGHANFDELRFDYFRDASIAFEAFKAGELDWHIENSAENWATGYSFPAVSEKRVILEEFPINNVGIMQAFAFNLRRDKFKDWRVRRAFNFAFDFEEINRDLFYGQYQRITSYFQGTDLASSGLPQGRELELLETLRGHVPAEVFTTAYWNPIGGSAERARSNLLQAMHLFAQAGFVVRGLTLVAAQSGEPFTVEFLLNDPGYERYVLVYKLALERLGIQVAVRTVDDAQYENRLREWDFDVVVNSWTESLSPGNEQRDYWGSQAAIQPGSRNLIGIKNPAVDALVDRVAFAASWTDLVAATRALDRVLLWNHYVVPQWSYGKVRTARWDRYGRPALMPKYGRSAFPSIWWWASPGGANDVSFRR
jgi:microcin C transport system substrate-binding protein